MSKLPWSERVNMLSINPHAATIEDIAKLAADASENYALRARVEVLEKAVEWACETQTHKDMYPNLVAELRRRAGGE
jgi:hypothetical protein